LSKLLSLRARRRFSGIPLPYIMGVYSMPGQTQFTLIPSFA
jgi:hypothetical protein